MSHTSPEGGKFTFFDRLEEEVKESDEAANSGVLSSIFGRLWSATPSTSNGSSSVFYTDEPTENATEPGASAITESIPEATLSPNDTPTHVQVSRAHSRTSQNSEDSDQSRKNSARLGWFRSKQKQHQLLDYNRSNFKQYWMPDSTGKECYQCEERFTTFRRRHHCRLCGQLFCAKCCNVNVPGSALGYTGELRLCHYCAKMMAQYLPPEADLKDKAFGLGTPPAEFSLLPETLPLDAQEIQASAIATVSAGNLMWSGSHSNSSEERRNSIAGAAPPINHRPPTMLSVQDLYHQHESAMPGRARKQSTSPSLLVEEDDSGPDWFRNMDTGTQSSVALKDEPQVLEKSVRDGVAAFMEGIEPVPLTSTPESSLPSTAQSAISLDTMEMEREESTKSMLTQKLSAPLSEPERCIQNDLNVLFERSWDRMMTYLFQREGLDPNVWRKIVNDLAREISTTLQVDVARGKDSMRVLNYVHVKKLVVDEEPSAQTIWGVVCSKSVVHKEMAGELRDASLMIVGGSIEYERISGKLSSIEPILAQEPSFLANQVDRILTRRPSVLLVEGGVSRIALDLLRRSGVRVVINVKPKVLHRVARSTGADILPSSDAQLVQQNIGFCPSFRQESVTLADRREKLLLIFDECPAEKAVSVLIRGRSLRELRAVKKMLLLMTQLAYSERLEKAYLNLFGARLAHQISSCQVCETRRENIDFDIADDDDRSEFERALSKSALTTSPFIEFETPFLETKKGRACDLLPFFRQPLYRFLTEREFKMQTSEDQSNIEKLNQMDIQTSLVDSTRQPAAVTRTPLGQDALVAVRALGSKIFRRRVESRPKEKELQNNGNSPSRQFRPQDVLDPYMHQRVAVLFGSFSPKSPNAPYFCVRPWVVSMQFYGDHDMTLGEFLTKFCFNKSYECPSAVCDVPMLDHSRKLVYGRVCVEVTTQQFVKDGKDENSDKQTTNGQIITWNYCPICKASSSVLGISSSVWHLSFAKYLDYMSNSGFTKGSVESASQQPCGHCFFHQQTHFFAYNNFVTTFNVTPVQPFNVSFSPVVCKIVPQQFSKKALMDGVTRMSSLACDLVHTATERLAEFQQHEQFSITNTFHIVLSQIVEKTKTFIDAKKGFVVELENTDCLVYAANDMYAVKANETVMYIREAMYQLITTWNDQTAILAAATARTMAASKREGIDVAAPESEISLERLDDPFPSYLHLGLKLQPRVGVVVRDIQDNRGTYKPDIGSIIAYALSMADYDECRRRQRDSMGGENVPLNLNAGSVPSEADQAAEHLEIEFKDAHASYFVKAYFAERFRLIRKLLFAEGEEAFIRSLSQTTFWTPQGGKSGSFFYRTQDDRFIVKQMSRFEIQSFVKFAPNYFEYIKTAVTEKKLTTLCKVYGVFRVGVKSKTTQLKVDILVMEYLFYKRNVDQVWDLKGSLRNRMASTGKSSSDLVLLDENLMKDLWNQQLYVYPHSKAALNQAISNDSHFLSAQDVMDYSLLVGVDRKSGDLILGIVDYMRTYTLDKKLESWVKIVAIPGAHLPTILSPEMYCTRFSEAIDTYFPVVPDQWTGLGSSVSY